MKDHFVTEIRQHRMEHARKFDFDIHAICSDLRKYQDELRSSFDIDSNKKFVNKSSGRTEKNSVGNI